MANESVALNPTRPKHRELDALLFSTSVWELERPTEFMNIGWGHTKQFTKVKTLNYGIKR